MNGDKFKNPTQVPVMFIIHFNKVSSFIQDSLVQPNNNYIYLITFNNTLMFSFQLQRLKSSVSYNI